MGGSFPSRNLGLEKKIAVERPVAQKSFTTSLVIAPNPTSNLDEVSGAVYPCLASILEGLHTVVEAQKEGEAIQCIMYQIERKSARVDAYIECGDSEPKGCVRGAGGVS